MERDALSLVARTTHNEIPGRNHAQCTKCISLHLVLPAMASLESTSQKFSSAFESCHNVHCTFFFFFFFFFFSFFFFFFFFFLALDNTDQCELGYSPGISPTRICGGRAPVSFPAMYQGPGLVHVGKYKVTKIICLPQHLAIVSEFESCTVKVGQAMWQLWRNGRSEWVNAIWLNCHHELCRALWCRQKLEKYHQPWSLANQRRFGQMGLGYKSYITFIFPDIVPNGQTK